MSKKKMSCRAPKKIGKTTDPRVIIDCETLSKMQLRKRYRHEANTHRNMLTREKSYRAVIHPDFREFANFLRLVGPIPALGATLDRIDNSDPEYAPGKVRWADKRTQNNNKSDTSVFHHSVTGNTYTASRLAKLQGVASNTIRKRKERGWSDDEIIEGMRFVLPPHQPGHGRFPKPIRPASRSLRTPQLNPSPRARDVAFQRMADRYEAMREDGDPEEVMAPYEFLIAEFPVFAATVTREQYERHFARQWPQHRPHVIFNRLPIVQQELIKKIDPEYVTTVTAKEGFRCAAKVKI